MRVVFGLALLAATAGMSSCAVPEQAETRADPALPAALPRLLVNGRAPIVGAEHFTADGRAWKLPLPTGRAQEAPFTSDADAVAAAKQWLVAHFGPLPPETGLDAVSVRHSAGGRDDEASRLAHPGHTVVLQQTWRGIPTRITSVVYIAGRSDFGGHFEFASFEPVAGSESPVIGVAAAVAAVLNWARTNGGLDDAALDALRRRLQPRLEYVYSPVRDEQFDLDPLYFDPTWGFGDGLMVDAVNGAVWRDC